MCLHSSFRKNDWLCIHTLEKVEKRDKFRGHGNYNTVKVTANNIGMIFIIPMMLSGV